MFFIINNALPKACISCGKIGGTLCTKCKSTLLKINIQTCIICENLANNGETHKTCKTKYTPEHTISVFKHSETAKNIINRAKGHPYAYNNLKILLKSSIFATAINLLPIKPDILIPIPQDIGLLSKRIKSLPVIIAEEISKLEGIPILITFKKNPFVFKKQKGKNKRNRMLHTQKLILTTDNIKKVKGKNILLIDDVTTTGATLLRATRLLKENKARTVTCLTITKDILES